MLIIGINGSPKNNGSTAYLVNHMLTRMSDKGAQVEMINAAELIRNGPSTCCTVCSNPCNGHCHKGNPLGDAYHRLGSADGIIMGSPVYFGTVSAQLKAFFDRTRSVRMEKRLLNTIGVGVTSGASRFGGQETTLRALHDMMLVQGMIIIGDGHQDSDCGHHGVCATRPAENDEIALTRANIAADRLWEVVLSTQPLRKG